MVTDMLGTCRLLETELNAAGKSSRDCCDETNRLRALLKLAASRSNGKDPAMQIIQDELADNLH